MSTSLYSKDIYFCNELSEFLMGLIMFVNIEEKCIHPLVYTTLLLHNKRFIVVRCT
jgi:hypothetical protein